MDMVEKVARALARSAGAEVTGPTRNRATDIFGHLPNRGALDLYVERYWEKHVNGARAAIEAMREPNTEMCRAGEAEMKARHPNLDSFNDPYVYSTWQAMITQALKEG